LLVIVISFGCGELGALWCRKIAIVKIFLKISRELYDFTTPELSLIEIPKHVSVAFRNDRDEVDYFIAGA